MFQYKYGSPLKTGSKKFSTPWIGPVKIQSVLDSSHFLISDQEGKCLPVEVDIHCIKPYSLNVFEEGEMTTIKNVYKHLEELKLIQDRKVYRDHVRSQEIQTQGVQTTKNDSQGDSFFSKNPR